MVSYSNNQLNLFTDDRNEYMVKTFRPIHYLGSKLRILDFIKDTVDKIDPSGGRVCDLFAGSGTVSYYLSKTRPVSSVDIQEYSRVLSSALLTSKPNKNNINSFLDKIRSSIHYNKLLKCVNPLIEYEKKCVNKALLGELDPLSELIEKGSIINFEKKLGSEEFSLDLRKSLASTISNLNNCNFMVGPEAMVTRYYGGLYFSYHQAVQIDSLLEVVSQLNDDSNKDFFLAVVLSTVSDIVNTVGKQFAQPLKPTNSDGTPKKNIINKVQKDRQDNTFSVFREWLREYTKLEEPNFENSIYRMDYSDALDILENNVKVIYADPPYTRYHYSRYYHVLESICLRDNPSITKIYTDGKEQLTRGIYRDDRHQSPFSIKSKAEDAFNILFEKTHKLDADLVLSYSPQGSAPRVLSVNKLHSIAKKYYKNIDIISAGQISHSKLNNSNNNSDVSYDAELLIVCQL